mmetsp:Transcript_87371/g.232826  ORF Transcript_87371/g.232826 Transcript_87371/m.232826 type:complete len:255 (+) Transcript_87371:105-869(+)
MCDRYQYLHGNICFTSKPEHEIDGSLGEANLHTGMMERNNRSNPTQMQEAYVHEIEMDSTPAARPATLEESQVTQVEEFRHAPSFDAQPVINVMHNSPIESDDTMTRPTSFRAQRMEQYVAEGSQRRDVGFWNRLCSSGFRTRSCCCKPLCICGTRENDSCELPWWCCGDIDDEDLDGHLRCVHICHIISELMRKIEPCVKLCIAFGLFAMIYTLGWIVWFDPKLLKEAQPAHPGIYGWIYFWFICYPGAPCST